MGGYFFYFNIFLSLPYFFPKKTFPVLSLQYIKKLMLPSDEPLQYPSGTNHVPSESSLGLHRYYITKFRLYPQYYTYIVQTSASGVRSDSASGVSPILKRHNHCIRTTNSPSTYMSVRNGRTFDQIVSEGVPTNQRRTRGLFVRVMLC